MRSGNVPVKSFPPTSKWVRAVQFTLGQGRPLAQGVGYGARQIVVIHIPGRQDRPEANTVQQGSSEQPSRYIATHQMCQGYQGDVVFHAPGDILRIECFIVLDIGRGTRDAIPAAFIGVDLVKWLEPSSSIWCGRHLPCLNNQGYGYKWQVAAESS
jgi:hypothetical protein